MRADRGTRMMVWGIRIGIDVGDPELEPAWDLICTPGDQKWSGGKEGELKLKPSKIELMDIPKRSRMPG